MPLEGLSCTLNYVHRFSGCVQLWNYHCQASGNILTASRAKGKPGNHQHSHLGYKIRQFFRQWMSNAMIASGRHSVPFCWNLVEVRRAKKARSALLCPKGQWRSYMGCGETFEKHPKDTVAIIYQVNQRPSTRNFTSISILLLGRVEKQFKSTTQK